MKTRAARGMTGRSLLRLRHFFATETLAACWMASEGLGLRGFTSLDAGETLAIVTMRRRRRFLPRRNALRALTRLAMRGHPDLLWLLGECTLPMLALSSGNIFETQPVLYVIPNSMLEIREARPIANVAGCQANRQSVSLDGFRRPSAIGETLTASCQKTRPRTLVLAREFSGSSPPFCRNRTTFWAMSGNTRQDSFRCHTPTLRC